MKHLLEYLQMITINKSRQFFDDYQQYAQLIPDQSDDSLKSERSFLNQDYAICVVNDRILLNRVQRQLEQFPNNYFLINQCVAISARLGLCYSELNKHKLAKQYFTICLEQQCHVNADTCNNRSFIMTTSLLVKSLVKQPDCSGKQLQKCYLNAVAKMQFIIQKGDENEIKQCADVIEYMQKISEQYLIQRFTKKCDNQQANLAAKNSSMWQTENFNLALPQTTTYKPNAY